MWLCERKKLRNGRPYLVWPVAKIACSSTKQGSIYIPKGIMDVLEEAHRRKAPSLLQKGVTITILGAISDARVIDISLRKPQAVSTSKWRKVDGKAVDAVNGRIGTRTEHFLAYLSNVMNVLDKNKMQGYYLGWTMRQSMPDKLRDLIEVGIIDIFHCTLRF